MVFQEFDQLPPWKTAKQNITFALRNGGRCATSREADDLAMEYIHKVKLDWCRHRTLDRSRPS